MKRLNTIVGFLLNYLLTYWLRLGYWKVNESELLLQSISGVTIALYPVDFNENREFDSRNKLIQKGNDKRMQMNMNAKIRYKKCIKFSHVIKCIKKLVFNN